ncbi:ornithine decarboxylase 1-like [Pieris brassicae]|uniref:ornithine decarboxylase 1-like n=1 Tax=Pieris brassicae TaxID=7116 RepID=UPI001E6613F5|nr:ornithine decarboxylase 1-like [Pieris brassicae]
MESRYTSKTYVLDKHTIEDIGTAIIESGFQKEAFFIQDLDEIRRRIENFKKMLPRVAIFYAIKSNDSETILKLAASLGLGFDCSTPGEIYKVLKLGVHPKSIIFASPIKMPEWMAYAKKSGITHTVFDSSFELKRIKQYWPDARTLIRIRVDSESVYRLGEKFGCDFETEAIPLLNEAAELKIKVVGVAFHVGSICNSTDSHATGIRHARSLFDYEARQGREMKIVDIGGGFLSEKTTDIDKVSQLINTSLEEFFPDKNVKIIAEPGRYVCDSSMTLYCSINTVKRIKKDNEYINMIYLNDGIYGTLQFTESWQTVSKFQKQKCTNTEEVREKTILWGYSLDSIDRVMKDTTVLLPRCCPLDWLVFPIRGAYSIVFCSSFGCFQQPQIRPVVSKELWLKIKDSRAFQRSEFVENPDISQPFSSAIPPIVTTTSYIEATASLPL